jgi:hypothetical protein
LLFLVQDFLPVPLGQLADPLEDLTGVPYDVSLWWSSSLLTSAVLTVPLGVVAVDVVRGRAPRRAWLILGLLLVVAVGTKASLVPVLMAGSAWCLWLQRRAGLRMLRPAAALFLAGAATMGGAALVLYRGEGQALELRPLRHAVALPIGNWVAPQGLPGRTVWVALGLVTLCLFSTAVPVMGQLLGMAQRAVSRDPGFQWCMGASMSGLVALVLLHHPFESQMYFWRNALPLGVAAASCGIVAAGQRLRRGHRLAAICAPLTGLALGLLLNLVAPGPHGAGPASAPLRLFQASIPWVAAAAAVVIGILVGRWVGRGSSPASSLLGLVLGVGLVCGLGAVRVATQVGWWTTTHRLGWEALAANAGQELDSHGMEAARWLRDHSAPSDVVLTNALCRNGATVVSACDNRNFWVTAYSERRTLVSGWGYTNRANRETHRDAPLQQQPFWDQERLAQVQTFLAHPTDEAAERLRALGVRWVLAAPSHEPVDRARLAHVASLEHVAGKFAVYSLGPAGQSS